MESRILIAAGIPVDGTITRGPKADSMPMEPVFSSGRVLTANCSHSRRLHTKRHTLHRD
jgi:hypothetical protein